MLKKIVIINTVNIQESIVIHKEKNILKRKNQGKE
jgi:carbonic anhydrase/acetyltransferase-like protein (isoleucine patch superfamily)